MTSKNNARHSDRAYEALKQNIIQLKLEPGMPIEENALMASLGIGRTPLREALQRLSQEDLIKSIPRKGYFVANVNHGDPLHVFEVRKQLEAFSARLAAERANEADIAEMDAYLEELAQGADTGDFSWNLDADLKVHQLIAHASRNPFLQQTLERLFSLTIRLLYLNKLPVTFVKDELEIYRAIFDAIRAHNPEAAAEAMLKHLGFPLLGAPWSNGSVVWPPTRSK
jgi:DNA-binding GntR family transcriptional regulator